MRIVADENIPFVHEAFGDFGVVETYPGRTIQRATVSDADALVVRSVTKVDARLLENTPVKFVGTTTIGEDHIDKPYLEQAGIAFASAPGSNANSVAEYVVAALLVLAEERGFTLEGRRLGIVGHGNVGKRVEQRVAALGIECVLNDPPLAEQTGDPRYQPLDALADCDIITFHVPLTREGPHPTYHLFNLRLADSLKTGAIVINTARGSVANGPELRRALEEGQLGAAVLDVWEDEPRIDRELLSNCAIGTPHIAGYSTDGKVNGVHMIHEALCRHLGVEPSWNPEPLLPPPAHPSVNITAGLNREQSLRRAVQAAYDIRKDDDALRSGMRLGSDDRAAHFDQLRKKYPVRREFRAVHAMLDDPDPTLAAALRGLGFPVLEPGA